ncbi:MAG: hypothetical protein AVDCRST_MAG86-3491 [uncultured Truepera sp.]|uniref:Outer membrane protein beta-barrel domain-containing protein n=1 Tax=uncultured Truepera sp. TaxID=543023 RepID=A0A6J4VV89_9DEIN|nr:MAG: hypothetical protein AVDCRST_MAG86-3491 [uncultured Truepera sp.]
MKKAWLLSVLAVLGLGVAQAQESYFGVGASVLTNFTDGAAPLLNLQFGGPVADTLELRGTVDTLLFLSNLGADLLYAFDVSPEVEGYAGGGVDFAYIFIPGLAAGSAFALHGTAGLEYRTGAVGLYGEVQPYGLLSAPILALKARVGINFYF